MSLLTVAAAPPSGTKAVAPAAPLASLDLAKITATGVNALAAFAAPFLRIVEGRGTFSDDESAVNAVMDVIAALDPAAAPLIAALQDAAPILALVASSAPVAGGYPDVVAEESATNFRDR